MKSFKTELKLNNCQRSKMAQHAGCARFAYNWGVALTRDNEGRMPSAIDLHKRFVAEVKSIHPWLYESSKCAPQQALRDLSEGWKRCFKKLGKRPTFKKKHQRDGFYLEGSIKIESHRIKLPKIGWVNTYEQLPTVPVKNVRITRKADRWFVAFKIPHEPKPTSKTRKVLGVDLGVKSLAVCSDGTEIPNAKAFRRLKRKLAHLQRSVSRKQKGSNNRKAAVKKVAALHYKISCIRKDTIHKATTWIAKNHGTIVIEDLNVSGMLRNHRLASAIADCGFYEFKRQLTYKSEWYGSTVLLANRWYPSSQLCSDCGHRQKMPLKERTYHCQNCGASKDRDLNAALNLEALADSSAVKGCGAVQTLAA